MFRILFFYAPQYCITDLPDRQSISPIRLYLLFIRNLNNCGYVDSLGYINSCTPNRSLLLSVVIDIELDVPTFIITGEFLLIIL